MEERTDSKIAEVQPGSVRVGLVKAATQVSRAASLPQAVLNRGKTS